MGENIKDLSVGKLPIAVDVAAWNRGCRPVLSDDCPAMKSDDNQHIPKSNTMMTNAPVVITDDHKTHRGHFTKLILSGMF